MRMTAIFFALAALCFAGIAQADTAQVQAREVARINNCVPKKIAVYQQTVGPEGDTIYRVDCTVAKATNENAKPGADALLIDCQAGTCSLLRPLAAESK